MVIVAGGLDPSGGAGLAADIGAIHASGAIALPVATSLTAQSASTAFAVWPVDPKIVARQLEAVWQDCRPTIIKTGLIQSEAMAKLLVDFVRKHELRLIVDPIIQSSSGFKMAGEQAEEFIKDVMIPAAYLITPNAPEAAALSGIEVNDANGAKAAAKKLVEYGADNVLITGGHINPDSDICADYLYNGVDFVEFRTPREPFDETRGTGCMLASSIAGYLAGGKAMEESITAAKAFVSGRIITATEIKGARLASFGEAEAKGKR